MSATPDYLIWRTETVANALELDELQGVEDEWELNEGVPRANGFPDDARFTADPELPYNTLLVDNLYNIDELIVVSSRLKDFLESRELNRVEYLLVSILNHKGRVAADDYFIVHPIEPVDCIDQALSGAQFSALDDDTISRVDKLVFDESKVDNRRELFRPKFFPSVTLVRRDLAEALDAAGFTGIRLLEIAQFPEL